jgi:hypothetical protein
LARRGQSAAHERVFLGIAITVTVVWAVATLVQVIDPKHQVPTYANLVMMTVAGSFFGGAVWAGRKNGTPPDTPTRRGKD